MDFHHQAIAHGGRTTQKGRNRNGFPPFLIPIILPR
jgi:hypothetical protein